MTPKLTVPAIAALLYLLLFPSVMSGQESLDRAALLLNDGRLNEARSAYVHATAEHPDAVGGWIGLAVAERGLMNYSAARAALDCALALEPGNADAIKLAAHLRWDHRAHVESWVGGNSASGTATRFQARYQATSRTTLFASRSSVGDRGDADIMGWGALPVTTAAVAYWPSSAVQGTLQLERIGDHSAGPPIGGHSAAAGVTYLGLSNLVIGALVRAVKPRGDGESVLVAIPRAGVVTPVGTVSMTAHLPSGGAEHAIAVGIDGQYWSRVTARASVVTLAGASATWAGTVAVMLTPTVGLGIERSAEPGASGPPFMLGLVARF